MLIYKNDGTLSFISQKTLKLAGYDDISQFLDEYSDFSELFIKKPGYIYNFKNFSWISFLKNANNMEQKRVLIGTRDNATYECSLELELLFPVDSEEGIPEYYYQIEFKNLKLVEGTAAQDFEISAENHDYGDIDLYPEAPGVVEEEISLSSIGMEEKKTEESVDFSIPEIIPEEKIPEELQTPHAKTLNESLDLVDFSFDEDRTEPTEEKKEETDVELSADNVFTTMQEQPESETKPKDSAPEKDDFTMFDLKIDEEAPKTSAEEIGKTDNVSLEEAAIFPEPTAESTKPEIPPLKMPDIAAISGTLGLPETLVKAFIKEFIDTYFNNIDEIRLAIQSGHLHVVKNEAIKLKGIASNLLMEPLVQLLEEVLSTKEKERITVLWNEIDAYIRQLSKLYAPASEEGNTANPKKSPPTTLTEHKKNEMTTESKILISEEIPGGETIEFDPNEASDALGLPASLIIEFVNDFIKQAKEEKIHFETASSNGEITMINEAAHKLKGVAANLRIEEMRTLMEKVQYAKTVEEAQKPLQAFYLKLAVLRETMAKEFA
ncbi:hypothetical protein [Hydrogenimonas sp.]